MDSGRSYHVRECVRSPEEWRPSKSSSWLESDTHRSVNLAGITLSPVPILCLLMYILKLLWMRDRLGMW